MSQVTAAEARPVALRPPRSERIGELWHGLKHNPTALFGFFLIGVLLVCAAIPSIVAPHEPYGVDFRLESQSPTWSHPFGTDQFGQDILSRVIYGARLDLRIAISAVAISLVIGTLIGAISGYVGGLTDESRDALHGHPAGVSPLHLRDGDRLRDGPGHQHGHHRDRRAEHPRLRAADAQRDALAPNPASTRWRRRSVGANHRIILFRHLVPELPGADLRDVDAAIWLGDSGSGRAFVHRARRRDVPGPNGAR